MRAEDKASVAPFRETHPFNVDLVNDEGHAVLYITDHPEGQSLHLGLANVSGKAIYLNPADPATNTTASADNFHFRVSFRAGTLSAPAVEALKGSLGEIKQLEESTAGGATPDALQQARTQLTQAGWNATLDSRSDGTVHVYLLSLVKAPVLLPPNFSTRLILPKLAADTSGGARGTRVEIAYRNLGYQNESAPIQGQRIVTLSILSRQGRRDIPLQLWVSSLMTAHLAGRYAAQ